MRLSISGSLFSARKILSIELALSERKLKYLKKKSTPSDVVRVRMSQKRSCQRFLPSGYFSLRRSMIMELAYRTVLLNPNIDGSEEVEGVVLIDEIDMHLHPKKEKEQRKQQLMEGSNKFLGEKIRG